LRGCITVATWERICWGNKLNTTRRMLLRILKNNTTAGYLVIPLLAAVAWLPSTRHDTVQQMVFDVNPMPLYSAVINHLPIDSPAARILGFVLVILTGFYLLRLNSSYSIIREKSLLPAFLFLMLVSSIPSLQRLHPALLAMIFLLFAFDRLLSSYKTERLSHNIFEASFLTGLGSLMYFNLIYFIILVWVALLVLRPVIWREWAFSIIGLIMPWVFYAAGYFFLNDTIAPVFDLLIGNFTIDDPNRFIFLPEIVFFSYLLILIFLASSHISNSMPMMKVLPRKIFVLFFWFWALSVIIYIFIETANIEMLVPAAVPVSFLLGHFFQYMRSRLLANLLLWGIVAGMIALSWVPW
jgi:hypothetical protein